MDAIDPMQEAEAAMHDRALAAARPRTGSRIGPGPGICVECGGPIAPARLAALPGARTCIDCQRELEGERWA